MNGASALAFIAASTLRNMVRRQLRRVREPRYLIASLFGLFYVVNLFVQPGLHRAGRPQSPLAVPMRTGALAWLGLAFVLAGWLFGGEENGLSFTEAEIQFLFPAPLTRRQLVSYKLVRSTLLALVSALLLTVTMGRRMAPSGPFFVIGAWLGTATLSLHLVAASLTRQSLLEHGMRGPLRRACALVVPALILTSVVVGVLLTPLHWPSRWSEVNPYFTTLFETPPVSWASAVFAPAARVAMAASLRDVLLWSPIAVGVLGLHYLWALSTDAAFEQASIASAERRGRNVDRMRRGQVAIRTKARPPFKLAPIGHPAVAIFWKNLTAAVRVLSLRVMIVVLLPAFVGLVTALATGASFNRELGAIGCAMLAASTTFFGVQVYRIDFRFDLPNLDLLKSYPIRGFHLALAELMAPFAVLTLAEWVFAGAAALLVTPSTPLPIDRVPFALAILLALPAITLPGLLVQNGAALVFPAWVDSGAAPPRGVEAIGQRLLTLMGTFFVVTLMLTPATAVGALIGALSFGVLGAYAIPLAAGVGAVVVALESVAGFWLLGRAFERFDPGIS